MLSPGEDSHRKLLTRSLAMVDSSQGEPAGGVRPQEMVIEGWYGVWEE